MDDIKNITKKDCVIHKLGYIGLLVACFSWGWNSEFFKIKK